MCSPNVDTGKVFVSKVDVTWDDDSLLFTATYSPLSKENVIRPIRDVITKQLQTFQGLLQPDGKLLGIRLSESSLKKFGENAVQVPSRNSIVVDDLSEFIYKYSYDSMASLTLYGLCWRKRCFTNKKLEANFQKLKSNSSFHVIE